MTPGEAIRGFLDALGVRAAQLPASLDAQAGAVPSLLAGRRMLVAAGQRPRRRAGAAAAARQPGCLVLVTSRNQLTGLAAAEGAQPLALDLLTARRGLSCWPPGSALTGSPPSPPPGRS